MMLSKNIFGIIICFLFITACDVRGGEDASVSPESSTLFEVSVPQIEAQTMQALSSEQLGDETNIVVALIDDLGNVIDIVEPISLEETANGYNVVLPNGVRADGVFIFGSGGTPTIAINQNLFDTSYQIAPTSSEKVTVDAVSTDILEHLLDEMADSQELNLGEFSPTLITNLLADVRSDFDMIEPIASLEQLPEELRLELEQSIVSGVAGMIAAEKQKTNSTVADVFVQDNEMLYQVVFDGFDPSVFDVTFITIQSGAIDSEWYSGGSLTGFYSFSKNTYVYVDGEWQNNPFGELTAINGKVMYEDVISEATFEGYAYDLSGQPFEALLPFYVGDDLDDLIEHNDQVANYVLPEGSTITYPTANVIDKLEGQELLEVHPDNDDFSNEMTMDELIAQLTADDFVNSSQTQNVTVIFNYPEEYCETEEPTLRCISREVRFFNNGNFNFGYYSDDWTWSIKEVNGLQYISLQTSYSEEDYTVFDPYNVIEYNNTLYIQDAEQTCEGAGCSEYYGDESTNNAFVNNVLFEGLKDLMVNLDISE